MSNRGVQFTPNQQLALKAQGSVAVSAAAGSGKTTVLAERCASLVCDGPAAQRCRVDELLVVTFTEAAASEMRTRIRRAIQKRLEVNPDDHYLREQVYGVDSAAISTIHAFCNQLIRRWFPQAQIDPQATLLAGEEATSLQRDVLEALFRELYDSTDDVGKLFREWVETYGVGDDREVSEVVLRLHDYLASLADPTGWLERCERQLDGDDPQSISAKLDAIQSERLIRELDLEIDYHDHLAATIRTCWPVAELHAEGIEEHGCQLRHWRQALSDDPAWEHVASLIRAFKYDRAKSRPRDLSEEEKQAFDAAKAVRDGAKAVFKKRLQLGITVFTGEEYRRGLTRIAPYVHTLREIVALFRDRYEEAKSQRAVLDFNDLQRGALRVLSQDGDVNTPSAIARHLQEQYRYVLIDEFQDVDPLQDAILRLISRESTEGLADNLFTVGDIKQSIYRFRLAEPRLFADRVNHFNSDKQAGKLVHLAENFRSRESVIDVINAIFRPLMSQEFGGCDYDDDNALKAGATTSTTDAPVFDKPALEIHLLESITEATRLQDDEADDDPEPGEDSDEELEGVEREAYLIGMRIHEWMGKLSGTHRHVLDKSRTSSDETVSRLLKFSDIVILLRALPHKARPMAEVLRRMGIPVAVGREEVSWDSTEFRDVYQLLHLIDNGQQDVPLASVLRSPILGQPSTEGELIEIRRHHREGPFHQAVARYVQDGPDEAIRNRLTLTLATVDGYRQRAHHVTVADLIGQLFDNHDYLSYITGLPNGLQRRQHLIRLHDLARRMSSHAQQSLHRFLRYVDDLIAREKSPSSKGAVSGSEDSVRIMTIHNSKGLEFPVVILADACKAFNLSDSRRKVMIDRDWGIAMRAIDYEKRIAYPTLLHQLASESARREDLSEELRLLYVALTRACDHLMVVGRTSISRMETYRSASQTSASGRSVAVPPLGLETAAHVVDWIMAGLIGSGTALEQGDLAQLYTHDRGTTDEWHIPHANPRDRHDELSRLARGKPINAQEPVGDGKKAQSILHRLEASYHALELTTVPARMSVTDAERGRRSTDELDERQTSTTPHRDPPLQAPTFIAGTHENEAIRQGQAMHRFLQRVDLHATCDLADLQAQLDARVNANQLTREDAECIAVESAAWFFATELGQRMRHNAPRVQRETSFTSRVSAQQYDPDVASDDPCDGILLRGAVDAMWANDDGVEIIDYKTDRVSASAVAERVERYQSQMRFYRQAMASAYRMPVRASWLVFLHPREIVRLTDETS